MPYINTMFLLHGSTSEGKGPIGYSVRDTDQLKVWMQRIREIEPHSFWRREEVLADYPTGRTASEALTKIVLERIVRHLCRLANSEFCSLTEAEWQERDPKKAIEQGLQAYLKKMPNLSDGEFVGGLRSFRESTRWPELAELCTGTLPVECARFVAASAELARLGSDVRPHAWLKFIEERLARQPTKNCDLDMFLGAVVSRRNDAVHGRSAVKADPVLAGASSVNHDELEEWHCILSHYLAPAVRALILDQRFVACISGLQAVTVRGKRGEGRDGKGIYDVKWASSIGGPEYPTEMTSNASASGDVVARFAVGTLAYLAPWQSFPRPRQPITDQRQRLLHLVLDHLLDKGYSPDRQTLAKWVELEKMDASIRPEDAVATCRSILEELRIWAEQVGEEIPQALSANGLDSKFLQLPAPDLPIAIRGLRDRVKLVAGFQRAAMIALAQNLDIVSDSDFVEYLGASPAVVLQHRVALVKEGKLEPLHGTMEKGRVYCTAARPERFDGIVLFLKQLLSEPSRAPSAQADPRIYELLNILHDFLLKGGEFETAAGGAVEELFTELRHRQTDNAPDGASKLADSPIGGEPSLRLVVGSREYDIKSVTKTLKEIRNSLTDRPQVLGTLPWRFGKTRYLAASQPRRAGADGVDGAEFSYPVPQEDDGKQLFFEGVNGRQDVAYLVALFLQRVGDEVHVHGGPPAREAEELCQVGDPADCPIGVRLVRSVDDTESSEVLASSTLEGYLAMLLKFLADKGRIATERLPVSLGKSRSLLSWKPFHQSGKAFDAPVHYRGFYMETAGSTLDPLAVAELLFEHFAGAEGWDGLGPEPLVADATEGEEAREEGDVSGGSLSIGRASRTKDRRELSLRLFGETLSGKTAKDFSTIVVTNLLRYGYLSVADLPISAGGRSRYLVNSVALHPAGDEGEERRFFSPNAVEHLFVETNYSRAEFLRQMVKLCQKYDPAATALASGDVL
jgi:hypothetical protein